MNDITIIYLTAGILPPNFVAYQRSILLDAVDGSPIIMVTRSQEDMEYGFGDLRILDSEEKSHYNMYVQVLKAAQMASTPFVAIAEDDTLYSKEHFFQFRPEPDEFAYDMSRWSLFTWNPVYSLKQRISNCTMMAPTKLLIEALSEKFEKYPTRKSMPDYFVCELGRNMYERQMGLTQWKSVRYYADVPCIQINHPTGTDTTGKRKKLGQIKAHDIPHWGRAKDLIKSYW